MTPPCNASITLKSQCLRRADHSTMDKNESGTMLIALQRDMYDEDLDTRYVKKQSAKAHILLNYQHTHDIDEGVTPISLNVLFTIELTADAFRSCKYLTNYKN
jgi:hypothetical protein